MTLVTYAVDPLLAPRHVLAAVVDGNVVCRAAPLELAALGDMGSVHYARSVLEGLQKLRSPAEIPTFVRWQGLCVAICEGDVLPTEQLFDTPLPARRQARPLVLATRTTA